MKVIGDHGCSHLIASTISCSHVYQMSKEQPHCGECSQCIDRRFGVLGAGLETEDPEGQYRLKLLVDEWKAGEPRTLAESYIRFAVDARNASDEAFYARFAGEISRAVQSLPGDRDTNARQLVDTQKRHAASVFSILEKEVARRASGLLDGSLPPYCLLRIAVTSHDQLRRTAEEVPILADETSARSDEPQRLRDGLGAPEIQIAVNEADQRRARSRRSRVQGCGLQAPQAPPGRLRRRSAESEGAGELPLHEHQHARDEASGPPTDGASASSPDPEATVRLVRRRLPATAGCADRELVVGGVSDQPSRSPAGPLRNGRCRSAVTLLESNVTTWVGQPGFPPVSCPKPVTTFCGAVYISDGLKSRHHRARSRG